MDSCEKISNVGFSESLKKLIKLKSLFLNLKG